MPTPNRCDWSACASEAAVTIKARCPSGHVREHIFCLAHKQPALDNLKDGWYLCYDFICRNLNNEKLRRMNFVSWSNEVKV